MSDTRDALVLPEDETAEEEERRTTFLELFFDLVFVFAITQVTALILEDPSARGFARGVLVLALVWWAWSAYTWMTNAVRIDSTAVRLLLLLATGASFFMALAVPDAYQDEGLWFAVPYAVVRVLQVAIYLWGLRGRDEEWRAFARLAPFFLVSPVLVVAGGLASGPTRTVLWSLSLIIDVAGALGQGRENGFRISVAHFSERYALFVIIALGESIVAIGVGASEIERDLTFALAVAVAFAGVAAVWWAYFDWVQLAAERRLRREPENRRGPLARDLYTLFHFPLVVGIIFYAVAAKKTLEHPVDPLSTAGRWALGIGIAAYLSSFALQRWRAVHVIAWERIAGGALSLLAVWLLADLDALALLALVVAVLVAVTFVETQRMREIRTSVRAGS